jgi:hypothetical protein
MMPARRRDRAEIAASNDGGKGQKKSQAGQWIRDLRWIADKIGKLFEKQGQLRRAETCAFAKTAVLFMLAFSSNLVAEQISSASSR